MEDRNFKLKNMPAPGNEPDPCSYMGGVEEDWGCDNCLCNSVSEWQQRLEDETLEVHNKLRKLKAAFLNSELKMSWKEWNLLQRQMEVMVDYLDILEERCQMYGLNIPSDLS